MGADLSLLVVDDSEMRALNHQWRGLDRTTDVLSFATCDALPMISGGQPESLGDLVISLPMAVRQAKRFRHPLTTELSRLLVHGILHLCGHDHVKGGAQAVRMRKAERQLMRLLRTTAQATARSPRKRT